MLLWKGKVLVVKNVFDNSCNDSLNRQYNINYYITRTVSKISIHISAKSILICIWNQNVIRVNICYINWNTILYWKILRSLCVYSFNSEAIERYFNQRKMYLFQHMKVCLNWKQLSLHDVPKLFFLNLFYKYEKENFYYFLFVVAACQIEDTITSIGGEEYIFFYLNGKIVVWNIFWFSFYGLI